jgi:hypothetical protein
MLHDPWGNISPAQPSRVGLSGGAIQPGAYLWRTVLRKFRSQVQAVWCPGAQRDPRSYGNLHPLRGSITEIVGRIEVGPLTAKSPQSSVLVQEIR